MMTTFLALYTENGLILDYTLTIDVWIFKYSTNETTYGEIAISRSGAENI